MNYQKKIEISLAKTNTSFTSTGNVNLKKIISYFIIGLFLTVIAELLPKIVLAVGERDVATSSNHDQKLEQEHIDLIKLSAFSDMDNLGIMNIERLTNLHLNDKNGKSDYGLNIVTSFDSKVFPLATFHKVRSSGQVYSIGFDDKNNTTTLGIRLNNNYSNLNITTENSTQSLVTNSTIGSIYSSTKIASNILLSSDIRVGQLTSHNDPYINLKKGEFWGTSLTAGYYYYPVKQMSLIPNCTISYDNLYLKAKAAENKIAIMPGLLLKTAIDLGNFKLKPELIINNEIGGMGRISTGIGISSKQLELKLIYGKSFSDRENIALNNFSGMFKINL